MEAGGTTGDAALNALPDAVLAEIARRDDFKAPAQPDTEPGARGLVREMERRAEDADPTAPPRHPWEVWVRGFSSDNNTATAFVARGTIVKSEDNLSDVVAVDGLSDTTSLTPGDIVALVVDFALDGTINAAGIYTGAPSGMDTYASGVLKAYKDNGASGNLYLAVLAQVRSPFTGQEGPRTDNGEWPVLETGEAIIQKAHTNFICSRWCMGAEKRLLWGLAPFSGGLD